MNANLRPDDKRLMTTHGSKQYKNFTTHKSVLTWSCFGVNIALSSNAITLDVSPTRRGRYRFDMSVVWSTVSHMSFLCDVEARSYRMCLLFTLSFIVYMGIIRGCIFVFTQTERYTHKQAERGIWCALTRFGLAMSKTTLHNVTCKYHGQHIYDMLCCLSQTSCHFQIW